MKVSEFQNFIIVCHWLSLGCPYQPHIKWVVIGELEVWGIFGNVIPILVRWKSQSIEGLSLSGFAYHCLPLPTIHLGFDKRNLKFGVPFGYSWSLSTLKIKGRRRLWFNNNNSYEPASGILSLFDSLYLFSQTHSSISNSSVQNPRSNSNCSLNTFHTYFWHCCFRVWSCPADLLNCMFLVRFSSNTTSKIRWWKFHQMARTPRTSHILCTPRTSCLPFPCTPCTPCTPRTLASLHFLYLSHPLHPSHPLHLSHPLHPSHFLHSCLASLTLMSCTPCTTCAHVLHPCLMPLSCLARGVRGVRGIRRYNGYKGCEGYKGCDGMWGVQGVWRQTELGFWVPTTHECKKFQ